MAEASSSSTDGRPRAGKFGLTVGGAFLVLGRIAWWRGTHVTAMVLG